MPSNYIIPRHSNKLPRFQRRNRASRAHTAPVISTVICMKGRGGSRGPSKTSRCKSVAKRFSLRLGFLQAKLGSFVSGPGCWVFLRCLNLGRHIECWELPILERAFYFWGHRHTWLMEPAPRSRLCAPPRRSFNLGKSSASTAPSWSNHGVY